MIINLAGAICGLDRYTVVFRNVKNELQHLDQFRRVHASLNSVNFLSFGIQNYQCGNAFNPKLARKLCITRISIHKYSNKDLTAGELDEIFV